MLDVPINMFLFGKRRMARFDFDDELSEAIPLIKVSILVFLRGFSYPARFVACARGVEWMK